MGRPHSRVPDPGVDRIRPFARRTRTAGRNASAFGFVANQKDRNTAMTDHQLQSMLFPAGPQAAAIHWLWNLMLVVCTIVLLLVGAALLAALIRRGNRVSDERRMRNA